MRGEDPGVECASDRVFGSPPHARGRLLEPMRSPTGQGITPACAGKTKSNRFRPNGTPDHPRMRGEDNFRLDLLSRNVGSPPHARGRLVSRLAFNDLHRITPACAGKTFCGR